MTTLANTPGEGADAPEPELANAEAQETETETEVETEAEDGQTETDESAEDVEYEGKTYKVPKPLKDALLRHADYTRKTQEIAATRDKLASERTSLEERQSAFNREIETQKAIEDARIELAALNKDVARFEKVDWRAFHQTNPGDASALWMEYQQTLNAVGKAERELHTKATKARQDYAAAAEAATAKQKSELSESLVRDIPGYSPELAGKMKDYAIREFGFKPQEVDGALDPRIHRLLHRAYTRDETHNKAAKEAAARKTAEASAGLKPVPQVGSTAHAARVSTTSRQSDKMTDAEWFKAEADRVARKNQRVAKRA